jgi:hypothetical protein
VAGGDGAALALFFAFFLFAFADFLAALLAAACSRFCTVAGGICAEGSAGDVAGPGVGEMVDVPPGRSARSAGDVVAGCANTSLLLASSG